MKKYYVIAIIIAYALCACENSSNKQENSSKESRQEEVFNKSIQNVFFGVPFGATKEELLEGFKKKGFYENSYSTDSWLSFDKRESGPHGLKYELFSFGDMTWEHLHASLANNRFYYIQFMNAHKTKEAALSDFTNVLNTVSTKYHMNEATPRDTTVYSVYTGRTNNNQEVQVFYYSYESVGHKRWIGVSLIYADYNYDIVSDEL